MEIEGWDADPPHHPRTSMKQSQLLFADVKPTLFLVCFDDWLFLFFFFFSCLRARETERDIGLFEFDSEEGVREMAEFLKIRVANPVVEMDGNPFTFHIHPSLFNSKAFNFWYIVVLKSKLYRMIMGI